AEQRTHRGLRAVGSDDELCAERALAAFDADRDRIGFVANFGDPRRRDELDTLRFLQTLPERFADRAHRHVVAERRQSRLLRGEARDAELAALGDVGPHDRLGETFDRVPRADRLEDAAARGGERDAALVPRGLAGRRRRRFDECDLAVRSCERGCKARADEAAADNRDVGGVATHAAISRSISRTSFGTSPVSTRGPLSVTSTSSSMRTPMPQYLRSTPFVPGAM